MSPFLIAIEHPLTGIMFFIVCQTGRLGWKLFDYTFLLNHRPPA